MSQNKFLCVRVHNFDKRTGHITRRYTVQGKRYDIDDGWYRVGRGIALELASEVHPSTSATVFEVVELVEAERIDEQEKTQPWAHALRSARDGIEVRLRDHTRRAEIIAARSTPDHERSDAWDDDDVDPPVEEAAPAVVEAPAAIEPKKTRGRPKSSKPGKKAVRTTRRSATK